ncbi:MAG: tetratricopeptide repeat protein [Planctomycetota bacterium]|nr:tetratricopeptide repeat protein [Planctomycetota bacterium]
MAAAYFAKRLKCGLTQRLASKIKRLLWYSCWLERSADLFLPVSVVLLGFLGIRLADIREKLVTEKQEVDQRAFDQQKIQFETERQEALQYREKMEIEREKDKSEIKRLKEMTSNVSPERIVASDFNGTTVISGKGIGFGPPDPNYGMNLMLQAADKAESPTELLSIGDSLVSQYPKVGIGSLVRGAALTQMKRYMDAEGSLSSAVQVGNLNKLHESHAYFLRAVCASNLSRPDLCISFLKRALEINPDNTDAKAALNQATSQNP